MTESLSIVVPVHNAQASLTRHVQTLLELLPELTAHFQILIVDDGSTDQTSELADELARQFPQVRSLSRRVRQGIPAATEVGLAAATGNIVMVQQAGGPNLGGELLRLWRQRHQPAPPAELRSVAEPRGSTSRRSDQNRRPDRRPNHAGQALRGDAPHHGPTARFQLVRPGASRTDAVSPVDPPTASRSAPSHSPLPIDSPPPLDASIRALYS